ncbi:hypothetical protein QTP88_005879 [Uroleucon formosanum]
MVDGKIINTLCNSSSQTCNICKCFPKDMNNLEIIYSLKCNDDNLQYGLSSLHAWIKCLECMLHIAYKKGILESNKRISVEQKNEMAIQKKKIQNGLWEKLGIKVDKVVQGKGTSNTGNIGRRFFEHAQEVSEITGLNKILIERFKVILSILACSYNVNFEKYDNYAKDTLKLYLQLYPWYRMPPSVHKILVHGSKAIHLAPFPIGILSEEAQEARNKDYIRFRRQNTRKTSRIDTNTDILHMFLITSDPIITSKSTQNIKEKNNKLCSKAMNLLNDIIETHTTRDLELDSNDSTEDSEFDSSDCSTDIDSDENSVVDTRKSPAPTTEGGQNNTTGSKIVSRFQVYGSCKTVYLSRYDVLCEHDTEKQNRPRGPSLVALLLHQFYKSGIERPVGPSSRLRSRLSASRPAMSSVG